MYGVQYITVLFAEIVPYREGTQRDQCYNAEQYGDPLWTIAHNGSRYDMLAGTFFQKPAGIVQDLSSMLLFGFIIRLFRQVTRNPPGIRFRFVVPVFKIG